MLTPGLRWFFTIAAALALIAGIQLFVLASETDRFFSWTIEPPLTAAFLGAAYWAACVLLAWAARQRSWWTARTALPPVFVIAVGLLVATLIHLDKFDLDSLFGWFWLITYIVVVPLLVALIAQQLPRVGERPARERETPAWLRALLALQAVALIALGAALFVAPTGADSLWPWVLTPLTGRAVGAFLIGFGTAAGFAVREGELAPLRGPALAYATLGALELLALAIHSDDVTASGAGTALYVAFCVSVLGAGLYGVASARRAASRS